MPTGAAGPARSLLWPAAPDPAASALWPAASWPSVAPAGGGSPWHAGHRRRSSPDDRRPPAPARASGHPPPDRHRPQPGHHPAACFRFIPPPRLGLRDGRRVSRHLAGHRGRASLRPGPRRARWPSPASRRSPIPPSARPRRPADGVFSAGAAARRPRGRRGRGSARTAAGGRGAAMAAEPGPSASRRLPLDRVPRRSAAALPEPGLVPPPQPTARMHNRPGRCRRATRSKLSSRPPFPEPPQLILGRQARLRRPRPAPPHPTKPTLIMPLARCAGEEGSVRFVHRPGSRLDS